MADVDAEAIARTRELLVEQHGALEDWEKAFCDDSCIRRYVRARGTPAKAAKGLHATLTWRREVDPDGIAASEFDAEFDKGRLYLSGVSDAGVPVMVTRKQADGLGEGGEERYLRHLVFTLESAAACTTNGAEQWVWIIDLRGYSRANSPPISTSIATLKVFADHYPERLRRAYIVDAPGIFSLLWRAVSPFVHAATRAKIAFVTSAEYRAAVDAADGQKLLDLDKKCLGFSEFYRHWLQPYDAAAYRRLLRDVCRRPAEPSLKARAGQSVAVDAEAHAA